MLATPFISLLFMAALQQTPGAIVQKQVAGPIVQKTSGWCSPVIANVVGKVTVNCIGVDPRALNRLNTELSRMNLQRADTIREAGQWISKYQELEAQLSKAGDDAVLSRQAEDYLHQGELEKAGAILDRVLAAEDKGTDHTAANHYNRALDYELLFNLPESLPHLKKAYQLATANETAPEEVKYGREYAHVLLLENEFGVAEPVLLAILGVARELAKANPAEYQPPLAAILNNLGVLYLYAHRTKEGEAIFNEVLTTYRRLVKTDPALYQLQLAGALNNLGLLYEEDRKYPEAVDAYREALEIDVQLAKEDPATYKPYLADTLTDIGNLYGDINRLEDADDAYQEALDIRRELAKTNPAVYQPMVALSLNNLGMIYADMKRPKEAEAADQEALNTYRQVAESNPGAYQPAMATTLYNLGRLYDATSQAKECEAAYQEALDIFRKLAADNPAAYGPNVAHTLYLLALVHFAMGDVPRATRESQECVTSNRERWKVNPEVAADDLAKCLVLASAAEPESLRQCQLAREAVNVARNPEVREIAIKKMSNCPEQ